MPRYNLENFSQNLARLQEYLDRNDPSNLCAIFDIGTKATKLLVGPKKAFTKETWNSSAFFNDGQLFPLGSDYDLFRGRLDIKSSGALEGVCYFVETYRTILSGAGMPMENMHGVGTAVFRWMNNQQEVVNHIRNHAGFDIHILKPEDEAYFSGLAILYTYTFGTASQDSLGDNDVILLFDQGGGSTEVSYFYPKGNPQGEHVTPHDSLHSFGTVSLQKMFFEFKKKEDSGAPDPSMNQNRISTQFGRVKDYLVERVADWPGFPELGGDKVRIHAYGMGTALSKCLGRGSNFALHNRVLTIRDMDETLARQCRELDNSSQQVRTLFAALKREQATRGKALSDRLVMLYGLPVYQQLLLKFGLDRLRFAGFGLRYGAYFAVGLGLKFDEFLSASKVDDSAMRQSVSDPIQVFLSHSSADNELAKRISEGLQKAGIKVFFDEAEIRVGDSFVEKIAEGISKSRFLAVMVSKNSLESHWVRKELNMKMAEEVKTKKVCVLPILVDECELPALLADTTYADFRTDFKSGLEDLLRTINAYK
jgi:exopolyphosphatase/pppGpp-phosphohydrolase